MAQRLLVNDQLTAIAGTRTFWHDLVEWFGCKFVGAPFPALAEAANTAAEEATLIIRNASYFGPLEASKRVPTIALLQDISTDGPIRQMQDTVIGSHVALVFNSEFTRSKYLPPSGEAFPWDCDDVIPLPVDFNLFEPGNALGLQQALGLPDGCVCWVGAQSEIKGWDIFLAIVRANPDIPFVAVLKDGPLAYGPPNLRTFVRLPQARLAEVISACRVGLCTSRVESQHLAGIEMGACGLPMVVPPVGIYWNLKPGGWPGSLVDHRDGPLAFGTAIRATLRWDEKLGQDPQQIRAYWQRKFDKPVIRSAWTSLVEEVECSGQS